MDTVNKSGLQFLSGGGEMGALTRTYPWENTCLGHPETWPQSLRTTLSILLNSRFPMFLWWGTELTCFYNDAYRPGLANNGKHPGALGQPAQEIWAETWDVMGPQIRQVMSGGGATWNEDRLVPIYRNGQLEDVYWTYSYSPVCDEYGEIAGVLVICNETTEKVNQLITAEDTRNQAQETIRESEALFRQLTEEAPMFVWITNTEAYMQYANKELLKYVGMDIQQLRLSNIWEEVTHPDDIPTVAAIYEQQKKHPEPFSVECRIREGATGKYNWFLFKGVPKIEKQVFLGFIGTAVNIQGFRDAEHTMVEFSQQLERQVAARTHELATANHQLRQTNQELEQFAYIASHDLQEPLRKVRTFAGMISDPDQQSKKLIDKIEVSAARMARLIHDVLNFSKLSASRKLFEAVDLEKVLNNIRTDFELLIEEKAALITHDPLPVVEGISLQLNQLFSNLLGNSLKFSKAGVPPQISIQVHPASAADFAASPELIPGKRYCVITFRDNGIGFKQEHAEKIFKIFQRLHSKDDYSGTGIGLALCKKIVMNHHGAIDAMAMPNEGAMFKVILPYEQTAE